ncbi:AAA domain-containing protein [Amycolatopsis sp. Poz14]|uniref:AAA domain-containing protein n=1 Tax=Amycolatopsis sp. Poz14 TaxID=1447705 RepID=UPI001EE93083|nr:AAA domain-containing protein [Amycolatopsis sp. Poz14]MCG3753195.1 AAA family ATPase [Amycolatopsis sp. Poz14]
MPGWKHELIEAVDEVLNRPSRSEQGEWRSLGKVVPAGENGWYALDLEPGKRNASSADSFDQLCLADKLGPEHGTPFPVERSQLADDVLRIQVAGRIPEGCDILWTVRLTPQHLWRKLRDGVSSLDGTPLADKLAAGGLDPVPNKATAYPPGFLETQQRAYAACVEPGLHAVWGPPGTGKTRVLARAIEDLVKLGRRVLLVSTANVAVDNALKEVVKHLAPEPGAVLRVGPPHLRELANNDDVQLHRLAARKTEEADAERQQVQDELERLAGADGELRQLDDALASYDHRSYLAAERRVADSRRLGAVETELRAVESDHRRTTEELGSARNTAGQLRAEAQRLEPQRAALARARDLENQLGAQHHQLALERARVENLEFQANASAGGWLRRRREARELSSAREDLQKLEDHARRQRETLGPIIEQIRAQAHPITEAQLSGIAQRCAEADGRVADAARRNAEDSRKLTELRARHGDIASRGVATEADFDLVTRATRLELPGLHERREQLKKQHRARERERAKLEERLREVTKRIAQLRRDAEGELVGQAQVVATTLARSRAHPAVARQQFDVVLVDEAGAAVLGEVLLAVGHATRTATLLGDFLQLGPVTGELEKSKKPAVRKWLLPDVFAHCGIRSPGDVEDEPGCVGLRYQFRFGPNLRQLANKVVYQVLEDGVTEVSGRAPANTEIVVVDVQGLDDINQVRRSGRVAGWWPVGALLSRVLVEHHAADPDGVGVVTAFRQQVEATHAALRDAGQNLAVPVGTAHAFQGRELGSVVFDLVEDGKGWISAAKWNGNEFARSGVRLFGVGITRARRRLYVIADGRLALKGAQGDSPLGALVALGREGAVQRCRASVLLGMAESVDFTPVSSVEAELNEVLRGLVDVMDIHDEFSFDKALHEQLAAVRRSLWMWSPWVGKKSGQFLALIASAVSRGADVRVFVRPERDHIMRQEANKEWVAALLATGAKVIRAEVEHRKIVVVDRQVVLLGSHNPLSQRRSREVMLACRGAAFAERLLADLDAETHGQPPVCDRCGRDFELWRSEAKAKNMPYFWRCHPCKIDRDVNARVRGTAAHGTA